MALLSFVGKLQTIFYCIEVVGHFMCQGKVSEAKQEAIKKMDMAKYESMKAQLDISQSHPDAADLSALKAAL